MTRVFLCLRAGRMDNRDMSNLDPYATGFLRTCYDAGLTEAQATLALLKRSSYNREVHGLPLDKVSSTILQEHGRLHRTQLHTQARAAFVHPCV